ncbi:hypothetical protein Nepgr_002394 [Nepenthes gracilis]|uniref:Uncharacterized protein n=1 Tax=Nepenthes gracilis TaxID=150966 RepID=A0AAD3P3S4_NEPGR|nr:hypothetical protein Nepgr_002394 [Nepenthes gracilis]
MNCNCSKFLGGIGVIILWRKLGCSWLFTSDSKEEFPQIVEISAEAKWSGYFTSVMVHSFYVVRFSKSRELLLLINMF